MRTRSLLLLLAMPVGLLAQGPSFSAHFMGQADCLGNGRILVQFSERETAFDVMKVWMMRREQRENGRTDLVEVLPIQRVPGRAFAIGPVFDAGEFTVFISGNGGRIEAVETYGDGGCSQRPRRGVPLVVPVDAEPIADALPQADADRGGLAAGSLEWREKKGDREERRPPKTDLESQEGKRKVGTGEDVVKQEALEEERQREEQEARRNWLLRDRYRKQHGGGMGSFTWGTRSAVVSGGGSGTGNGGTPRGGSSGIGRSLSEKR
ncbi:MAG: hypothetical protein KDB96_07855 [Flavobacteriales bacterium]|nr:hypothetical protein [Flavobacteriales bacterium]